MSDPPLTRMTLRSDNHSSPKLSPSQLKTSDIGHNGRHSKPFIKREGESEFEAIYHNSQRDHVRSDESKPSIECKSESEATYCNEDSRRDYVRSDEDTKDSRDNYLTNIDFEDPTKSYPTVDEESLQNLLTHRVLQRLDVLVPFQIRQGSSKTDDAWFLDKFADLLVRVAGSIKLDVKDKVSFDEFEELLLFWCSGRSIRDQSRMVDILDGIVDSDWDFKDLPYVSYEDKKHYETFMKGVYRKAILAWKSRRGVDDQLDTYKDESDTNAINISKDWCRDESVNA